MRRRLDALTRLQLYQVFAFVCLILVFAIGVAAVAIVQNRDQGQEIALLRARAQAEDEAKVTAKRVEVRANYGRCLASIDNVRRANAIIEGFRDFLIDSLKDSKRLLAADPHSRDAMVRRSIIAKRTRQIAALQRFPTVTKRWCEARRDRALRRIGA